MSAAKKKSGEPRKRKVNGYSMPEPIQNGEVVTDTAKNSWCIGPSIGMGGFGEIYAASKIGERTQHYVVKIEPQENGPLFCERNVYVRIGKKEDLEEFIKIRKLKHLGMPQFHGFGTHCYRGTKYRFLVMEKYGKDLWSYFLESNRKFPLHTVCRIAIQVVNVLEYIHFKGYVHADIKGSNLLLASQKGPASHVFLIDFGLASRYSEGEFKPDPKKAHNGTIEYTSRDAHEGVTTRRGDIEILGYNMLHWLCSTLPWEKLKNPDTVFMQKAKSMIDISSFLAKCFGNEIVPDSLSSLFETVRNMKHNEQPNYNTLRQLLADEIKKQGYNIDGPLEFQFKCSSSGKKTERRKTPENKKKNNTTSRRTPKKTEDTNPEVPVKIRKTVDRKAAVTKRSWRDFPTIVNGAQPYQDLPSTSKQQ